MKERLIKAVIALIMAGMAVLFGMAAWHAHVEHVRHLDFAQWVQSPGTLKRLVLHQTLHRAVWQYDVAVQYSFDFGGGTHTGSVFDLKAPIYPTAAEGKAAVERALAIAPGAQWHREYRGSIETWLLETRDMAVTVRHSPRDPSVSSLTPTPPMSPVLDWVVIVVLCLLCLATALGFLVLAVAACLPSGDEPMPSGPGDERS